MALRLDQQQEAAKLLVRIMTAIDEGELTADGPAATVVAHRLEGALLALESSIESGGRMGSEVS